MSERSFDLSQASLNRLFPMHIVFAASGEVDSIGPTLSKVLSPKCALTHLFEFISIDRPRRLHTIEDLFNAAGKTLHLNLHAADDQPLQLRCVMCPVDGDPPRLLADLSFGANLAQAVHRFGLSGPDFKPNDFSIDLFYTFETQQTLLEDSRKLADALKSAKEDAERKAVLDPLTGISNRYGLHQHLLDMVSPTTKDDHHHALLHVDLDAFKQVNDTFGHSAGDAVLRHTASTLSAFASDNDLAARIGGDEFALVLQDGEHPDALAQIAKQLNAALAEPVRHGEHCCQVRASIGILRFSKRDTHNVDHILNRSDIALYESKRSGGEATFLTPRMIEEHAVQAARINEIENAVIDQNFVPFFQPQIDLADNSVSGFEVLARWQGKDGQITPPAEFLELARKANLLPEIDRQVRQKAMEICADWQRSGLFTGKLSLNVTAANLRATDFCETLQDELFAAGMTTGNIQLELLESVLFDQSDQDLVDRCLHLRAAGFTLALDDFGTGHASIATLIDAPITMLKIDRSFIHGFDKNAKLRRIVGSMIAMASEIGLEVLAEGVETRSELDLLRHGRCGFVQGYLFAPPLDRKDTVAWLQDRTRAAPSQDGAA